MDATCQSSFLPTVLLEPDATTNQTILVSVSWPVEHSSRNLLADTPRFSGPDNFSKPKTMTAFHTLNVKIICLQFSSISGAMSHTLESWQRTTAKRVAKDVLGSPAPRWSELGDDVKELRYQSWLALLRTTDNNGIADILEKNKALGMTILQEKAKSMRSEERRTLKR